MLTLTTHLQLLFTNKVNTSQVGQFLNYFQTKPFKKKFRPNQTNQTNSFSQIKTFFAI